MIRSFSNSLARAIFHTESFHLYSVASEYRDLVSLNLVHRRLFSTVSPFFFFSANSLKLTRPDTGKSYFPTSKVKEPLPFIFEYTHFEIKDLMLFETVSRDVPYCSTNSFSDGSFVFGLIFLIEFVQLNFHRWLKNLFTAHCISPFFQLILKGRFFRIVNSNIAKEKAF